MIMLFFNGIRQAKEMVEADVINKVSEALEKRKRKLNERFT